MIGGVLDLAESRADLEVYVVGPSSYGSQAISGLIGKEAIALKRTSQFLHPAAKMGPAWASAGRFFFVAILGYLKHGHT
jgi:hypothetical protein